MNSPIAQSRNQPSLLDGSYVKQATLSAVEMDPAARDAHYNGNMAQFLVDLHDTTATFDFCGGMMFQLVLSEKLRNHLVDIASLGENGRQQQPVVYDTAINRMAKIPGYSKSEEADNIRIFHGREVRQVAKAAGGMGFVLHLSLAGQEDPEGWTQDELAGYDGWGHDSQRIWRKGNQLESEGFETFKSKFGARAFTLHHRFYLHLDGTNQIWLSAEDGCEGTPAQSPRRPFLGIF